MFISATAVMKQINQMEANLICSSLKERQRDYCLHLQVNRIIGMLNL